MRRPGPDMRPQAFIAKVVYATFSDIDDSMQRIGYVVAAGFRVIDVGAMSTFEFANLSAAEPLYEVHFVSETGRRVRGSLGIITETETFDDNHYDTIIVGGGAAPAECTLRLIAFVQRAHLKSRRLAAIGAGTYALAEAGVLDGRRATTHRSHVRDLQNRFPLVKVEEDRIFVVDGSVWTSAGMSASVDMALHMIEEDLGAEVASMACKLMVMHNRRAGGQSQHSALLDLDAKSDRIQNALEYAKLNLRTSLSVERMADAAHLSPRQFSRAFHADTGKSPAKAVETLRVEAARVMMEQGRHPMDIVANETGFADREQMRRAFLRAYAQSPQTMRRNARVGTRP